MPGPRVRDGRRVRDHRIDAGPAVTKISTMKRGTTNLEGAIWRFSLNNSAKCGGKNAAKNWTEINFLIRQKFLQVKIEVEGKHLTFQKLESNENWRTLTQSHRLPPLFLSDPTPPPPGDGKK